MADADPHRSPGGSDSAAPDRLADDLRGRAAAWARPEEVAALAEEMAAAMGKQPQRQTEQSPAPDEPRSEDTTPETWLVTGW